MLLYLYKYIRVYLYINIKKKSVPNTWIFQVHGKKTWLKGSQQNGHFFFSHSLSYFFIVFLIHCGIWWSRADQDSSLYCIC